MSGDALSVPHDPNTGMAVGVGRMGSVDVPVKRPLQVRLQPPTSPMCGILAPAGPCESRLTRRPRINLMPTYLAPFKVVRKQPYAPTRAVGQLVLHPKITG